MRDETAFVQAKHTLEIITVIFRWIIDAKIRRHEDYHGEACTPNLQISRRVIADIRSLDKEPHQ